jgi:TolB-like protein/Tfp pilus assembly protein PilF
MADPSLFQELRRRKVFRVAVAYVIIAWLVLQVVDVLLPMLELPNSIGKVVLILLAIGLPIALLLAWVFELTPAGIQKETDSAATEPVSTGNRNSRSIAVLPLENLSRDTANEPFTIGVHDDLITQISKISSIKTISRTSVMQYRETTKTVPQIAAELGVATILEGGIQKAGDRVHVNVQLIDAASDHHLWSDTYDRQLTAQNIFSIQEEIATAVAKALHATLSPQQKDRLAIVPTKNMAALEAYFVGRQNMATRTVLTLQKAVTHFERAIELDPEFALAYVGLSDAVVLQNVYGNLPEDEMLSTVEPLLNKALKLDGHLGEAYASLGGLKYHTHAYDEAEGLYKKALELNPNYATTYGWYGTLLMDGLDRVLEAFKMHSRAAELDPLSCTFNINLGIVHDVLGDFDAALRQYHRVAELDPAYAIVYPHIGFVYWEAHGDLVEAFPWFVKAIEQSPASPNYPSYLGLLYLDLGDEIHAEQWIEKALELGSTTYRPNVARALFALRRGDAAAIRKFATRALAGRPNIWWGWAAHAQLRNDDLRAGRTHEARARYERAYPKLSNGIDLKVNRTNFRVAIDYAMVLDKCGEDKRANELLDRCMTFIRTIPRMGQEGYWISDAAIHSLRGDIKSALAAMREAIDHGWCAFWWYYFTYDPNFDAVRDDPEFQAMAKELSSKMADQLDRL